MTREKLFEKTETYSLTDGGESEPSLIFQGVEPDSEPAAGATVNLTADVEFGSAGNYELEIECSAGDESGVIATDSFEADESWVGASWDVSGKFDIPDGAEELTVVVRAYVV